MDRRHFIGSLAALGCAGALTPLSEFSAFAEPKGKKSKAKFDENLVVFMSDMHTNPGSYQPDKCRKVISDILAMRPLPRNVVTFGDLAYLTGKEEEYALAKELCAPLEEAGIKVTHGMGNHDRRENFAKYFPEKAAATLFPGKYVFKVETPRADIIMLDSLQEGNDTTTWITEGALDEAQALWLKSALAASSKPTFVCSHHPIKEVGIANILIDSPCCCGYIHGHDHRWRVDWFKKSYSSTRMIRTLCLPSTGHWGDIGFTIFRLEEDRAVAELCQSEFFFPKPVENPAEAPAQWKMITDDHKGLTCTFSYK